MTDYCACGTIASARCVRCSEPKCSDHYFLSVDYTYRKPWETTARGPLGASFRLSGEKFRDPDYVASYAEGGPGCTSCRSRAAALGVIDAKTQQATYLDTFIEEFMKSPSAEKLASIETEQDPYTIFTPGQAKIIVQAITSSQPYDMELCTIGLARHPRFEAKFFAQNKPIVTVKHRRRATHIPGGNCFIDDAGDVYVGQKSLTSCAANSAWLYLIGSTNMPVPTFELTGLGWSGGCGRRAMFTERTNHNLPIGKIIERSRPN